MRKKNEWEKRGIKSASLGIKKTIPLSIEEELDYFRSFLGLGSYTELNKKFLMERMQVDERNFDKKIINFILKEAEIPERKYSELFRLFLANLIIKNAEKKEQKERFKKYVKSKEYE